MLVEIAPFYLSSFNFGAAHCPFHFRYFSLSSKYQTQRMVIHGNTSATAVMLSTHSNGKSLSPSMTPNASIWKWTGKDYVRMRRSLGIITHATISANFE